MDLPSGNGQILAQPTRARIFAQLVECRTAVSTGEVAKRLGKHPNGVRRHLEQLHEAGLVQRLRSRGGRGRPGDLWAVASGARPGGADPSDYANLARWLARATPSGPSRLRIIENTGREIGRELAPASTEDPVESFRTVLATLGFQPMIETNGNGFTCRLENCPYRASVRENPDVICTLHRGLSAGLLSRLDPKAKLVRFEPHDPESAGCLVGVEGLTVGR
jgi:predicted ArsR family transcriptional regulator